MRVTTAMIPLIVSSDRFGASSVISPLGFSAVLTKPGSALLSESEILSRSSGFPRRTNPNTTAARANAGKTEKKA
jgi:hypothetical protein